MKKTLIVSTLFISSIVNAQTAGNWPLNSNLNGTAGSHLSISAVSPGSSITSNTFNSGSEWYGEGGWTAASTLDPNGYVQFSLTANSGYWLSLTQVTLIQRRSNTGTPQGAGPNSWSLRSSLDNYATDITTGTLGINYATFTINLPAAYQAIPNSVTFRIYGYSTTINSGGISRFVFDNISVTGKANSGTLAAQFIRIDAKAKEGNVDLQWKKDGFAEGTEFSLERAADGVNFQSILKTQTLTSYTDASAPTTAYYRIVATQADGNSYYSPIAIAKGEAKEQTAIKTIISQGNAVKTLLNLQGTGAYQVCIWSQDGKPLARQTVNGQAGEMQSDIAFNHPHGIYILTLYHENGMSSRKFVF
jgi:hypothetical protein